MNNDALRIGAVGCGYWGPNLIRNFVEIPETEVIAIADLLQAQLDHVKRRYPQIQVTTQNYRDLFELGLDAVVIATPPHTHFPIARDCLNHGLHALVEKPITLSSRDAYELTNIAEREGLILMVGHTFEFNPAVHVLKGMIHSGELGEVYYVDAVRASLGLFQTEINVIWDLAPHDISILRYILGAEPLNICTHASACVQAGIEDIAYATLQFPNDVLAHIRMSWLDPAKTRRITVVGSQKMVIYDDVENLEKIRVYDKGVKAIRRTDTFGEFHFAYHYGDVVIPFIRSEEPLRLECLSFVESIQEGVAPSTDGYSGIRVVQIIEAAQESLRQRGQPVTIGDMPVLEPENDGGLILLKPRFAEYVMIEPPYTIDETTELGYLTGRSIPNRTLEIGRSAHIRCGSVVYAGSTIGANLQTGHNVIIREENVIGDHVEIWSNSIIDYGCRIGDYVKIHANVYVAQFSMIEDDVFLAPGVTIANDPHPLCRQCTQENGPTIKNGARIGINVTILPGVVIGETALVGAGTVVTKNVPNKAVIYGNPGRIAKCTDEISCPHDPAGRAYVDGLDRQTRERMRQNILEE